MRHTLMRLFPKWAILGILVGFILGNSPEVHAAKTGQSWAVVIGIEDYLHEPTLQYAEDDAREMASILGQLGFQVLPPLYNEAATHDAILELIQGQLIHKVSPQDRVVVYFSGHGVTWGQEGQQQLGYLMPVEGNRKSPYLQGISMQEIRGIANALPARQVLFLIDACYGGMAGGVEKGGALPVMDDMYVQQLQREKGRWLMTAGGADQEALELGERQHGAFTYFLLEGLGSQRAADKDNNRYVTIGELFHFVKPRVFEQAQYLGKRQVPELWNLSMGDKGEMVFVYPQSSPIASGSTTEPTPLALPPEPYVQRSKPDVPQRASKPVSPSIKCLTSTRATIQRSKPYITVSYVEPTTKANGQPLDNLAKTTIYYNLGKGLVKYKDIPATNPQGGGRIQEKISFTISEGASIQATICVTTTNKDG